MLQLGHYKYIALISKGWNDYMILKCIVQVCCLYSASNESNCTHLRASINMKGALRDLHLILVKWRHFDLTLRLIDGLNQPKMKQLSFPNILNIHDKQINCLHAYKAEHFFYNPSTATAIHQWRITRTLERTIYIIHHVGPSKIVDDGFSSIAFILAAHGAFR